MKNTNSPFDGSIIIRFSPGWPSLADEILAFLRMKPLNPFTYPVYAWWFLRPTSSGYSRVDSV